MLEELRGNIFVNGILPGELERHPHEVEAKHSHPARAIALFKMTAAGQGRAPIEDADIIEAKEAALENIFSFGVLPVHPPGERDEQFVKNRFQKSAVAFASLFLFNFVNAPGRPTDHRRIDVAEIPFVSRDLTVGMLVPFAQNDIELTLGEERVDQSEGNAMEREIPRRVPRVFPFIRHRHDALIVEMAPFGITSGVSLRWWRRLVRIAV